MNSRSPSEKPCRGNKNLVFINIDIIQYVMGNAASEPKVPGAYFILPK
jgi:hypothetical protein